jgi:hypothetical protein
MRYADAMARAWPAQATFDREALIACSDECARHGAHGMERTAWSIAASAPRRAAAARRRASGCSPRWRREIRAYCA